MGESYGCQVGWKSVVNLDCNKMIRISNKAEIFLNSSPLYNNVMCIYKNRLLFTNCRNQTDMIILRTTGVRRTKALPVKLKKASLLHEIFTS